MFFVLLFIYTGLLICLFFFLSELFARHLWLSFILVFPPLVMKLSSFVEDLCYNFYGELVVGQTRNFLVCGVSSVLWFKFIHVNMIFCMNEKCEVSCNSHFYLSHYASLTVQLFFTYLSVEYCHPLQNVHRHNTIRNSLHAKLAFHLGFYYSYKLIWRSLSLETALCLYLSL